jgi:signal transduction histidine kinase
MNMTYDFSNLYQTETVTVTNHAGATVFVVGTGLGLAVSQAIAHAHGGRIEADTGPLGGARFTLYLPPAGEGA